MKREGSRVLESIQHVKPGLFGIAVDMVALHGVLDLIAINIKLLFLDLHLFIREGLQIRIAIVEALLES